MADIRLGNLLWKNNTQPISVSNPVNTKDVNSDSIEAELTAVKNELKLVKAELQEIKANQLSGDQKVTLKDASGAVVSPATEATLEQVRALLSGVATENKLEQARVLLNTISTKDFATQTTLAAVLAKLGQLETEIQAVKANQLSGDQKVQLSGTIPEITTIIDAVAVTEANAFVDDVGTLIPGTLIDKYVDWDLFVINTHDSAFRCSFMPVDLFNSTPSLVMRDGSVKNYSTGTIPGATAQHLIPAESYPIALGTIPAKAGDVEAVDTHPYKNYAGDLRLYLRSVNAPTKGSITVKLVGRLR